MGQVPPLPHPAAADLLVIETASVLAGPLAGQFFAELGATVVKIENPGTGGDVTRHWKTPAEDPGTGRAAYFCSVNWGKRSIALDLKTAKGRAVLEELLARADVWIDNFPPAALRRMGLDAQDLQARNPRLVHARIYAYGPENPKPGYDAALQAETGLMAMNGTPDSGPLKMPLAMVDILAAHQLKQGVLLALWEREKTGRGREVAVSLYDAGVTTLANQAGNYLVAGQTAGRQGSGHPNIVPYGTVFECAGGEPLVLAVGSDRQFASLCEVLGEPALAAQDEFASNRDRVGNRGLLNRRLAELISRCGRGGLLAELERRKVPAAPVMGLNEVLDDARTAPLLMQESAGGMTGLRTVAFRCSGDAGPAPVLREPPELNQDAREVLGQVLGYPEARIDAFLAT